MKILIVAHLDDEIIWFNPTTFDKIIICFPFRRVETKRIDFNEKIYRVFQRHPLRNKMELLGLTSGEYWRKATDFEQFMLYVDKKNLTRLLFDDIVNQASLIFTHNEWGEYGHSDHQVVHEVVKKLSKVPIYCFNGVKPLFTGSTFPINMDLEVFKRIKNLYLSEDIWTWEKDFQISPVQKYFRV